MHFRPYNQTCSALIREVRLMKEINWLKKAVTIGIDNNLADDIKKTKFVQLKNEFDLFTSEEKYFITKTIQEQFDTSDQIYILSILFFYNISESFTDSILSALLKNEFDAYTGSVMEVQIRNCNEYRQFYQKVRTFHKKNVLCFEEILNISFSYIYQKDRNQKRIIIVTEQLLHMNHAPTIIVLNFAYALKNLGYEVLIFSCPCNRGIADNLWYHPMYMRSLEQFTHFPMKIRFQDETIDAYQIDMNNNCVKEYHMMLTMIYAWNPIFVLDLGTINPVVDLTRNFTTLVSWNMDIACPISEGSILIRTGKLEDDLEEKYKQILGSKQRQCFMEDKFPILAENTKDAFSRTELELPEDKFLIAIVGNRLNEDLNIRFIALMETLLSEAPQIDFVVIGNISSVKEKLTETIFTDRVHYLGYQEQLVKVYPALDLYLNPERTGGGLSAVMALITGIPVVTLPNCDVAGNVGEEFVAADYDKMIETVIRYTSDQDFYNQKVAQAQLFKESNTNDNLVKYIQKLIDRVLALIAEEEKNAGI